jgi:hypothetical protein
MFDSAESPHGKTSTTREDVAPEVAAGYDIHMDVLG